MSTTIAMMIHAKPPRGAGSKRAGIVRKHLLLLLLPGLIALTGCDKGTDLGTPCTIEAPCTGGVCGFRPDQIYVDRESGQCETACLLDRAERPAAGSTPAQPAILCDGTEGPPGCVDPEKLQEAAFCTCRCNAPKNTSGFCECPDGYACTHLETQLDSRQGSYCRRRGG